MGVYLHTCLLLLLCMYHSFICWIIDIPLTILAYGSNRSTIPVLRLLSPFNKMWIDQQTHCCSHQINGSHSIEDRLLPGFSCQSVSWICVNMNVYCFHCLWEHFWKCKSWHSLLYLYLSLFHTVVQILVQSSSFHSWTITCVDCLSVWSLTAPLLLVGQTRLLRAQSV